MTLSRPHVALAALLLLALLLRAAMTSGGLWLDEAWSAVLAEQARTPAGVFLAIHHDNNHHLNSLWMQAVGMAAPSWLQRLPAIITGVAGVAVAAAIGWRRSPATGLAAALLFAVVPVFVTYGAEARGYAPATLATLVAILLTDRWLDGRVPAPRLALALCFAIGALAQLLIAFALCALAGWIFAERCRHERPLAALRATVDVLLPSASAVIGFVFVVVGTPIFQGVPMQVGTLIPYDPVLLWRGLTGLLSHLLVMPDYGAVWPALLALASVAAGFALRLPRRFLYLFAVVAFPIGIAVVRPPNVDNARYYLLAGTALLLLWADLVGRLWQRSRPASLTTAAILAATGFYTDLRLIRDARGDPDGPVRLMQQARPGGASVLLERWGGRAVQQVAARQAGYRLHVVINGCAPADFLLVNRFQREPFGNHRRYCGLRWAPIAQDRSEGMTEESWRLYRRLP